MNNSEPYQNSTNTTFDNEPTVESLDSSFYTFFVMKMILFVLYLFVISVMIHHRKTVWKEPFYRLIFTVAYIDILYNVIDLVRTISVFSGVYILGLSVNYGINTLAWSIWYCVLAVQLWIAIERFISIVLYTRAPMLLTPKRTYTMCLIGGFYGHIFIGIPIALYAPMHTNLATFATIYDNINNSRVLFVFDQAYSYTVVVLIMLIYISIFFFSCHYYKGGQTWDTKILQFKMLLQGLILALLMLTIDICWYYVSNHLVVRFIGALMWGGNPIVYLCVDRRVRQKCRLALSKVSPIFAPTTTVHSINKHSTRKGADKTKRSSHKNSLASNKIAPHVAEPVPIEDVPEIGLPRTVSN